MDNILNLCCTEMPSRHDNLKRYFPFFELLRLNKDSTKFKEYDMSTIALSILEFMLMEGKLKEKGVHFNEIEEFLDNFIKKAYETELSKEELRELTRYILLKLQNNGEPFRYEYYDTAKKKMVVDTIRYIVFKPSYKSDNEFLYYLTSEGIDFFLQTKEFGEESKVTIYLLLLQKQLQNNDFENVYNLVVKINTQVQQQIDRKREISESLIYASLDSFSKYIEYSDNSVKYLTEEKDLFTSTYSLVKEIREEYIKKSGIEIADMKESEKKNIQYLWDTDKELSLTIEKHSRLLKELVSLKKEVIEIRNERRKKVFRKSFDFESFLYDAMKTNNIISLKAILAPLFNLKTRKDFSPEKIESMFTKINTKKTEEIIEEEMVAELGDVISLNQIAEDRLYQNFKIYFKILLKLLTKDNECDLALLVDWIKNKYGEDAVSHPDFSSFIISLYHRKDIGKVFASFNYREIIKKGNTASMIETIYMELIEEDDQFNIFKYTVLDVEFIEESIIKIADGLTITNFIFKR